MAENRLKRHVNYSIKELEEYVNLPNSCVYRINTNLHVSILPYSLEDFKRHLLLYIIRKKVSFYDSQVDGIVLDIRNIKVLNTIAAMRANDPNLHVDLNADFYVFRPVANALVNGLVKYIGDKIVGVTIYKVFSAQIRFAEKIDKSQVCLGQELQFRIKDFDLQNIFPYIMGELPGHTETPVKKERVRKIKFEHCDEEEDDVTTKEPEDLDKLISLIEPDITKSRKRKYDFISSAVESTPDIKIKIEEVDESSSDSDVIEINNSNGISVAKPKLESSFIESSLSDKSTESAISKKKRKKLNDYPNKKVDSNKIDIDSNSNNLFKINLIGETQSKLKKSKKGILTNGVS